MPRKVDYRDAGDMPNRLKQLVIKHEIEELRKYAGHREPGREPAYEKPAPEYKPRFSK